MYAIRSYYELHRPDRAGEEGDEGVDRDDNRHPLVVRAEEHADHQMRHQGPRRTDEQQLPAAQRVHEPQRRDGGQHVDQRNGAES